MTRPVTRGTAAKHSPTSPSHRLRVDLAENVLELFAAGGVYDPATDSLFVADLHLGKDNTFRRNGLAVPQGSNESTLDAISDLVRCTHPSRLVLLGDLIHEPSSLSRQVVDCFADFCAQFCTLDIHLVRGNHDRVTAFPASWRMTEWAAGTRLGGVALYHEPVEPPAGELAIAGHVHPSYRMQSQQESLGRLPCFWFHRNCLVLPAIGRFTGTHTIRRRGHDRVWVNADGVLLEIPSRAVPNRNAGNC
ncbi:MAG: ligase-associated DNA damage response endonuclease PdeM [Planctomycetota bacterium]